MNLLPCGDRAVLMECRSATEARAVRAVLAERFDTTLGATTVLVRASENAVRAALAAGGTGQQPGVDTGRTHRVTVHYDGPDLALVADHTGLSVAEVIEAHTARGWHVGFAGFSPGFAYLDDGDPRLDVPRLGSPRPRVPAGSVGLAGRFSGIYPRSSAGGWLLIGTTTTPLWDLTLDPPALFQPGDRVRFEAI